MTTDDEGLTVGDVSDRAGLSPATLRYYERLGLVSATRTAGNQRRYARHVLRRLAFVAAGQRVGLTLRQVHDLLTQLPDDRAPTQQDWTRLAGPWRELVAARVRELQALQNSLDECLGCGCLSLTRCALFNPGDSAATDGAGSRWLREAASEATPAPTSSASAPPNPGDAGERISSQLFDGAGPTHLSVASCDRHREAAGGLVPRTTHTTHGL